MIYASKEECYNDILLSLLLETVTEYGLKYLRTFYEGTEQYECCQGIAEAYVKYKEIQLDEAKNNTESLRREIINRITEED